LERSERRSDVNRIRTAACAAITGALLFAPTASAEEGYASFYDESFEGKETASGERFDPDLLTAAHPDHPPNTILRVTNLENGKSVRVRVTDHGPAKRERREGVVIDLSEAAAEKLAMTDEGKAKVSVEVEKKGESK
jgi:rare lipoprotein A